MNRQFILDTESKRYLLKVARESIKMKLSNSQFEHPSSIPETLNFKSGCFVTLHLNGELRGCIGNFRQDVNIVKNVSEMAISAAFSDPRFYPITATELEKCKIEVSILSPMIRCKAEDIVVGRDGIYIKKGYYSGVLLPQVAMEYNFDRKTFLDHTCIKARLKPGCWEDEKTEIYRFEADIFSEE